MYFVVVPWLTRNWPTTSARVVEIVPEDPDGLIARYRRHKHGKDYGIEYVVRGQRYRKNPNIEAYIKSDGFGANSVSIIHESFEVRFHPDDPSRYRIAHAYKPWAVWVFTGACLLFGGLAIWHSL